MGRRRMKHERGENCDDCTVSVSDDDDLAVYGYQALIEMSSESGIPLPYMNTNT